LEIKKNVWFKLDTEEDISCFASSFSYLDNIKSLNSWLHRFPPGLRPYKIPLLLGRITENNDFKWLLAITTVTEEQDNTSGCSVFSNEGTEALFPVWAPQICDFIKRSV
jgi:hypothetical protein